MPDMKYVSKHVCACDKDKAKELVMEQVIASFVNAAAAAAAHVNARSNDCTRECAFDSLHWRANACAP